MVEKNDEVNASLWMQIEPEMIWSQSDDLRGKMIGKVIVARSQRIEYRSNETQRNLPIGFWGGWWSEGVKYTFLLLNCYPTHAAPDVHGSRWAD